MRSEPSLAHTGKPGLSCMSCGRSDDEAYENRLKIEQAKDHVNWKTYGTGTPVYGGRKDKRGLS